MNRIDQNEPCHHGGAPDRVAGRVRILFRQRRRLRRRHQTALPPTTTTPESTNDLGVTTTIPSATTTPAVVQDVSDSPRTTDYVGARDEVTGITCVQDGDVWRVSGTVTNPTEAAADYRIFIAFLDGTNETRGLLQTDINDVVAGESKDWNGELAIDADDLTCGLRVERTGINGTPPPSDPVTS